MIFNQQLMFIHIGKTGGTSCADYLLQTLRRPVYNCHTGADRQQVRLQDPGIIAVTAVQRHCTLQDAGRCMRDLTGRDIRDLKQIIAVIRNPCTLEYSYYRHMQKEAVGELRPGAGKVARELARGDFKRFIQQAGYHGPGLPQEAFFLIDGKPPDNLTLVRFENLEREFLAAVQPYTDAPVNDALPHRLKTDYALELEALLDSETRELIYQKHRYMFDHYYPDAL